MTIFYNAFHSPIGAHSSFTLGCRGRNGGLGLELGGPADENIYIGLETKKGGQFEALPFYAGTDDEAERYDHANQSRKQDQILAPYAGKKIKREFSLGTDGWQAGDLEFKIYSLAEGVPEPGKGSASELKKLLCPTVIAELTIDNTKCKRDRRAFFGFTASGSTDALNIDQVNRQISGLAKGQATGIYCDDPSVIPAKHMSVEPILKETHSFNYQQHLGSTGLLLCPVAAGTKKTFRFAICFYRGGIVTTGMPCSYLYHRYYNSLADVAKVAFASFSWLKGRAHVADRFLEKKKVSSDQQWMMAHAIRSYFGSTQLLEHKKKPVWVVNEGEYRMINTFDLTVDQIFFEMEMNPWTVKNELDLFTQRYSYTDKLHFPGEESVHPGGLSFTHDMGVCNHFTAPGLSSYERAGLDGCFSHMTHEQLVNWVLCAAVYAKGSGDKKWLKSNLPVFKKCLRSLLNRDHPKGKERNGIMGLDSSRTEKGAEITTYDSLDTSLGQARNNVYIALKGWASYLAMEEIFGDFKLKKESEVASGQAKLAASTIASHLSSEGYIPAVMGENCDSKIIPAIEGLIFPYVLGQKKALQDRGPYGELIRALKVHFKTVLKEGTCLYPDGGWKLSSTADNSWLSKIYLCQFVARKILGFDSPATRSKADKAHKNWLLNQENLRFAWSDQMSSGVAKGSKYYPRGVTSILWMKE